MSSLDDVLCLFSAQIEQRDGARIVRIPDRELETGAIEEGATYRVALLPSSAEATQPTADTATAAPDSDDTAAPESPRPDPPVDEGERRVVEIEDIGDQGDGITRVERGYVVIVPDTEQSERVEIEIADVQPNVAFAEVVERRRYYD